MLKDWEELSSVTGRATVADRIKHMILERQMRPGEPLPTESELCADVGASRSAVREAIKTLRALDIVEVRHGYGSYVGRMSLNALVESLTFRGLLSSSDDHQVLSNLISVQQALAQGFAQQLVDQTTPERREKLARITDQMYTKATKGQAFVEEDRTFHLELMEPLRNELVLQLTAAFWEVQAIIAPTLSATAADAVATADLHAGIINSLAHGDARAVQRAIAAHYDPVRDLLRGLPTPSPVATQ